MLWAYFERPIDEGQKKNAGVVLAPALDKPQKWTLPSPNFKMDTVYWLFDDHTILPFTLEKLLTNKFKY